MISIIIVNYNAGESLLRCLQHLYNDLRSTPSEVILVDNASEDQSLEGAVAAFPGVQVIKNRLNVGFAEANNMATERATGDYLLYLNPDAFLMPGCIEHASRFMEANPTCAMLGGQLQNEQGTTQPSARQFPGVWSKLMTLSGLSSRFPSSKIANGHEFGSENLNQAQIVDWVPGTFAFCRKKALLQVGCFDKRFFLYYEETDLCRKLSREGWEIWYHPAIRLTHIGGVCSRKKHTLFDQKAAQNRRLRMLSEWQYFRKNHGFGIMACQAALEWGWHGFRNAKNRIYGQSQKAQESSHIMRLIWATLRETRWGLYSPPKPW